MSDKYLSIITNFGCHYTCPYCIVKNNDIDIPKTTIEGLQNLEKSILDNGCNIVSLSGGGDPLFRYCLNKDYYDSLFKILDKIEVPLELHTSYVYSTFPYVKCKRVVYHLNMFNKDVISDIKKRGKEIIRVVFVVTDDMTEQDIFDIVDMVKNTPYIEELSFRQRVDKDYKLSYHLHDFLTKGHQKNWWYITQDDYNLYYAENKIYHKYSDFRREIK